MENFYTLSSPKFWKIIINGDFFGNFTCLKYNGNSHDSVVDYNIISKDVYDIVSSFHVLPITELSDHRPLSLELIVHEKPYVNQNTITLSECPGKFVFNRETKTDYINTLLLPCTQHKIQTFNGHQYAQNEEGIENATKDFSDIFRSSQNFH